LKRSISVAVSISDSTPGNGNASTVLHKFTTLRQLVIVTDALADVDKKHLKRERRCAYCTLLESAIRLLEASFLLVVSRPTEFHRGRVRADQLDSESPPDSSAIA
jgi:hypothetical protein